MDVASRLALLNKVWSKRAHYCYMSHVIVIIININIIINVGCEENNYTVLLYQSLVVLSIVSFPTNTFSFFFNVGLILGLVLKCLTVDSLNLTNTSTQSWVRFLPRCVCISVFRRPFDFLQPDDCQMTFDFLLSSFPSNQETSLKETS